MRRAWSRVLKASLETTQIEGGARQAPPPAHLGSLIALGGAFALASLMLIAPIVHGALPVTELPAPLLDHHQDAETLTFLLGFAVLLPLAAWAVPRVADRVLAGANGEALPGITAALVLLLGLDLLIGRAASSAAMSAGAAIWLLVAIGSLLALAGSREWEPAARIAPLGGWLWETAAIVTGVSAFAFSDLGSVSWPGLALGLAAGVALLLARERISPPAAGRWGGRGADAVVILLLLLAVPNLVIFPAGAPGDGIDSAIIQFHQNFFLGPANQVLAGDAMLVDTLSQYGVGSIYFLAGVFQFVPIGNGTLGLIEGLLSALMFIGAWMVMRIAGVPRLLAAATMAVAVVVLVYGLQYPLGGLLQHGAIRFGMPIGVVVGAVAESRWPARRASAQLLQLLTVAVASIWALEAFAYTLLTLAAVIAVDAHLAAAGERRRAAVRRVGQVIAACVVAHVLLAGLTLLARGELPDWGWYLNTLREFLFGPIGDLTYDFSPWSPGLAVGALYLVSAIALALVLARRRDVADSDRTLLVAIAGMTAFGVALFSYIVNRSADHIIPYVCLPAVTLGALWLTLLGRPALAVGPAGRRAGWALAIAIAALLVAVAASSVSKRFHESALAFARPGGASFTDALHRLWDPPARPPAAADGERLLAEDMPGEAESSVLTAADLSIEILLRSGRGSAVPLGDPWEDSFVPEDHLRRLREYVDGLNPGDRILIDDAARAAFELYRREPSRDPLVAPAGGVTVVPSGLATLQEWTLKEIGRHFGLRTVERAPSGLAVVELIPRG